MSHATDRILEQLQTQDDLRMQAANEIAQVVAAHIEVEQYLEEAKAAERMAEALRGQPPQLVIPLRTVAPEIPVPPLKEAGRDPPAMEREGVT